MLPISPTLRSGSLEFMLPKEILLLGNTVRVPLNANHSYCQGTLTPVFAEYSGERGIISLSEIIDLMMMRR